MSLSPHQEALLTAVKRGTLCRVQEIFGTSNIEKDDTYFDYMLLITALARKHKAISNFLLKKGCRASMPNSDAAHSPLHYAVKMNDSDLVSKLLRKGTSIYSKGSEDARTALCEVVKLRRRNMSMANAFLKKCNYDSIDPGSQDDLNHFHVACLMNCQNYIWKFLRMGFPLNSHSDLDAPATDGFTPLHFAIANGSLYTARLLLNKGADVAVTTKLGLTPLHLACETGNKQVISLLLERGADLAAVDAEGRTPLHTAFYSLPNDDDLINFLLARSSSRADAADAADAANAADARGLTYFHIACTRDNPDVVEGFRQLDRMIGLRIDSDGKLYSGYSALHLAVEFNRKYIVELLLERGAAADCRTRETNLTPLHLACKYSELKFRRLVDECLDKKNYSVDWTVNRRFQTEIVELVLSREPEVNARDSLGRTALVYACVIDLPTIDRQRCSRISVSDEDKYNSMLAKEMSERREKIVQILFVHKANFAVLTEDGKSLLHLVIKDDACNATTEFCESLISKGVNVDVADNTGTTALHLAVEYSLAGLVRRLLAHKANVNARTESLVTPLHVAAKKSDEFDGGILKLLLEHGADVNAQNLSGETPLYEAFLAQNRSHVEELLRRGADVNVTNGAGMPILLKQLYTIVRLVVMGGFDGDTLYIVELIMLHLQKLEALKFHVNETIRDYCNGILRTYRERFAQVNFGDVDGIRKQCCMELDSLKLVKIDNYSSLYDVIYKSGEDMAKHVANENFMAIIASDSFESQFPLFGYLIKLQFARGSARRVLLAPSQDALDYLIGFRLPHVCFEHILKHLTNEDLDRLIRAKPDDDNQRRTRDEQNVDEPSKKFRRLE